MERKKSKGKKEKRGAIAVHKPQTGQFITKADAARLDKISMRGGRTEVPEKINKTKKTKGK